jgi:AraC-like DNA-binding protein
MTNLPRRAPYPASASSYLANLVLHYAKQVGVDPAEVCTVAGVAAETLADPAARLPHQMFNALWQAVAQRSGDPDFGLHLAQAADQMAAGSLLQAVLMNCATVGNALDKLTRYHGLTTDMVGLHVRLQGLEVRCGLEAAASGLALQRHHLEAMTGSLAGTLRRLTRDQVQFSAVHFTHAPPADTAEHRRLFGCPVRFGQARNELRFSRDVLTWPVALANVQLLEKLEQLAQAMPSQYAPDKWADRVARQISQKLLQGEKPDLEAVAKALALGPRQLQNRLREEDATFQRLLDALRKDAALRYLQDGELSLCDIAFLLGFTEQSAFNHAFKRWTGGRPREFQRRAN